MEDRNQPSENAAGQSPLTWIEYGSVVIAIAGTAAAAITQQVVYAAAPLSLSVLLNLVNRPRGAASSSSGASSSQVRILSQDVESLKQHLLKEKKENAGPDLAPQVRQLQEQLTQLQQQYNSLSESTFTMAPLVEPTGMPELEQLSSSLQASEQRLIELEQQVAQWQASSVAPAEGTPALDPEQMQTALEAIAAPLRQQMGLLEARLEQLAQIEPASTPAPGVAPEALDQMQAQVQSLTTQVEAALASLSQTLAALPATVTATVEQKLAETPGMTAPAIAPGEVDAELQSLTSQIEASLDKIGQGLTVLPTLLESTHQRLTTQLQQQATEPAVLVDLKQDISNLDLKLSMGLANLSDDVQGIPNLVESLVQKHLQGVNLESSATSFSSTTDQSTDMMDLDSLLSDLE